ncbi:SPFH/Band 7/PHB domain protein [Hellea sp.]|nr:SPFH domain-containing protein [Hellea sp.]MDA8887510.1 SPFH/Band 7/PHB domain protein [Hellea sp.]MDA9047990.1 SPFH/Band 7/PHB domain protein [Hellea sp.]MDB4844320.1 SPFH/Band 7/PHB domain protein [Hellea sp.]MDC0421736.1 SPFH/Band 7/PHB domain protein [Hellea sp.]MDC0651615.1 SPFH/Band 7/PHB domain protein [Hellea sp.]
MPSFTFIALAILIAFFIKSGIQVVPQTREYVVERFGKYTKTLKTGLNFIVPIIDKVSSKVDILETQLDELRISVVTKDNVEVDLISAVFYRVTNAEKSVYRIDNVANAIEQTSKSIIRSEGGKLDLDALQSSRDSMNIQVYEQLKKAAEIWGIEVTRAEILDVQLDEETKEAQRQQLNAERKRRATVAEAEGQKETIELNADANLYKAEKEADAIKLKADAEAYKVKLLADAEAEQTKVVGDAIKKHGQAAVNFEIMKRQVDGLTELASSGQTKTLIMPSEITKVLGGIELLAESVKGSKSK